MSELNTQIKQAIDTFDMPRARELLRDAMKEANAETYYLASLAALDEDQKREFLEKAVALDPFHEKARTALKGGASVSSHNAGGAVQASSPSSASHASSPLNPANMVTAIVGGDAGEVSLRHIPVDSGMVVTTLRKEARVFLISRDDYADWFQALYESPLGIKYGWLRADQIEGINFRGNAINIFDLPITNFELNTRDDLKQLIKEREAIETKALMKSGWNIADSYGCGGSGLLVIAGIALSNVSGINISIFPFLIGAVLIYAISQIKSFKLQAPYRKKYKIWTKQRQRLNQIQSNMRSDYEVMRDDQRRDTAIGFAMNLGATLLNTAASRYIPNRQKVTIEQKTNRK